MAALFVGLQIYQIKIGETITNSKLRENEILKDDQEINLLTIKDFPTSDPINYKKNSDMFHRTTKLNGFPRKQISFYREFSSSKPATTRVMEDGYRTSSLRSQEEDA